ncbi:unnamed protein product, partial [Effrenium voratum]
QLAWSRPYAQMTEPTCSRLLVALCISRICQGFAEPWLEEAEFTHSLIQQGFQLSGRVISLDLESQSAEAVAGPDLETLGLRVVDFPPGLFCIPAAVGLLIIVHECRVSCGMQPLLARNKDVTQLGCQLLSLWNWSSIFVSM